MDGTNDGARKWALGAAIAGGALVLGGTVAYFVRKRQTARNALGRPTRIQGRVSVGDMTLTHHSDPEMPIEQRVGILQDLVWKGVQNPQMRELALAITGNGNRDVQVGKRVFRVKGAACPARDGLCETKAVHDWVKDNVRYTGDVAPVKMGRDGPVEGIDLFQGGWRSAEFGGGDCLPAGTLLLTEDYELVPIEAIKPGTKIWGRDTWTAVERTWYKGLLPVDVVTLNTGSTFKATPDHKVYVARCLRHKDEGFKCACDVQDREVVRIRVSELRPGMVMVDPERLPFGTESLNLDRAFIEGLYLAHGWSGHNTRFDIAGRDGKPKEAQKRAVQEACERLGIPTTWQTKYISIRDKEWTLRIHQMGKRAPEKHALSINLDEASAAALLRGLQADCDVRDGVFTSTSRMLAIQFRLLNKMFGTRCGMRYLEDHGGLGDHPVWRGGPRRRPEEGFSSKKLLRVRSVERDVITLPVYDITTEDHYVYLPEADVTVSNCDDHSVLSATLLSLNGVPARFRITAPRKKAEWAHIFVLGGLPKTRPRKWVPLDTTLPGDMFGREAPSGKHIDFAA